VPFPDKGLVYDYYVKTDDEGNVGMAPWEDRVEAFTYNPVESFGNMFVNTVETTRMKYFLNSFVSNRHYCMFVGNTGTSKTAIMMNMLRNMDAETMSSYVINMNSFSDAPSLQPTLEAPLEKKSGVRYGLPCTRLHMCACVCLCACALVCAGLLLLLDQKSGALCGSCFFSCFCM
jgi:dynein heavy chain, axonemal